jgi:hypothetical protein
MFIGERLSATLVFLFCFVLQAGGQQIAEPLNTEVALAGVVREVHGYGPPGYGENKKKDMPITYWVLDLPTSVNVPCTPEKPEWASVDCRSTKRLRLFFPVSPSGSNLEIKAKAMKGRSAVVSGILHRKDTLGEITPIYMNVTDLQPSRLPDKR